ncbi:MAG: ATP-dependent DNA helicase RecG, partial [Prevotellaceae bacterium]|nr:ATP-dependent DNA helicase RecG [Prevotellaceae bacterium]
MMELTSPDIKFLPGVGPRKAEILNKEANIFTLEDVLYYFPYKYVDRSHIYKVNELSGNMPYVQLKGKIIRMGTEGDGRNKRFKALFQDNTGHIELVWFKGLKFIEGKYKLNTDYIVFGKPAVFGNTYSIAHPEIEEPDEQGAPRTTGLQAHYNTTEKMKSAYLNSAAIRKIVAAVFQQVRNVEFTETLPAYILQKYKFLLLKDALFNIHFPQNADLLKKAENRLKFEELFYIQLSILQKTKQRQAVYRGFDFPVIGHYFNTFYEKNLPFELTGAQKRVLKEIRADVRGGKQMNRLLQGDVGSGKTLVALMSMLMSIDNGYQAAMMAPTEILATQHYETLTELLKNTGVNVALLTGSTKRKEREKTAGQLLSGELHILIGTHALIEDTVQFRNLGLVVIDEQHRFGVQQRAKLWMKNERPPHVLVMTATPIPRTLAMTVYGDLDVSVIDELPPGRQPVQTYHYFDNKRHAMNGFIAKQVAQGRQVYVVYPLIQESETLDFRHLEEGYEYLRETFPHYKIGIVHGKLKPAEKDAAMQKFVSGETNILVATTVIEVGVNVPNATVMIIESAERFGLSQLHQLRGRVGRGAAQSFCILLTKFNIGTDTRKRLNIMVRSNDGFEIAEADLQLRGPGNIDGIQQSGLPFDLKIASLTKDSAILQL